MIKYEIKIKGVRNPIEYDLTSGQADALIAEFEKADNENGDYVQGQYTKHPYEDKPKEPLIDRIKNEIVNDRNWLSMKSNSSECPMLSSFYEIRAKQVQECLDKILYLEKEDKK